MVQLIHPETADNSRVEYIADYGEEAPPRPSPQGREAVLWGHLERDESRSGSLGDFCGGRDASTPRGKVLAMRKARRVMMVKKMIVFIILCCFLIL